MKSSYSTATHQQKRESQANQKALRASGVVNLVTALALLFSACVPQASPSSAEHIGVSETANFRSRVLPKREPVFYTPPDLKQPERTDPTPDSADPDIPGRETAADVLDFSLEASPGTLEPNGVVTFTVTLHNRSAENLLALNFVDQLESGFEFLEDAGSPVTYDVPTREVRYSISQLTAGDELSFTYQLQITASGARYSRGEVWTHSAELESGDGNLSLKAQTALGFDLGFEGGQVALIEPGGWSELGEVAVYIPTAAAPENTILAVVPTQVQGVGPELQFSVETFQTTLLEAGAEGRVGIQSPGTDQFSAPIYMDLKLDSFADLENIPAGQEAYVATYDEALDIWVKVPLMASDPIANTLTVKTDHFSIWGAGLGNSLPQNGSNLLLFDQPYTSLFTGASRYSIPVWTPPGRAGMSPGVSLTYSSGTMDGLLGDVQGSWVGAGWNIDGIEVVRKITTDENGYGYENDFALTLNGTIYELEADPLNLGRYFTTHDAFLYIERHNYPFGNEKLDGSSPPNSSGEWWEVVTSDGTRYRLGWNPDAEQLALMYGYKCTDGGLTCLTPDGAYAPSGYAGIAENLVAMRWRVDRITDTHGNYIEYSYYESQPAAATTIAPFDRESYLDSIRYTGFDHPSGGEDLDPAYEVDFVYGERSTIGDVPVEFNIWDNIDSQFLDRIDVCYGMCGESGSITARSYDLGHTLADVPNENGTMTLTSLEISAGDFTEDGQTIPETNAPTITFSYENLDNREISGEDDPYPYPRLSSVDNGFGAVISYTYENDGRETDSWYNYRVSQVEVDGGNGLTSKQSYAYETAKYTGEGGNPDLGDLVGYETVTESLLDYNNGDAVIVDTKHTFGIEGLDIGRELTTEWLDDGTVLRKATQTYVTDNSQAPYPGWNFRYLFESASYEKTGVDLELISRSRTTRDAGTGNTLMSADYSEGALVRKTYYEYYSNTNPIVYIIDKVSRALLVNGSNQILTDTRYHYDDTIATVPTVGDLTLVQRLTGNGDETADLGSVYDVYGNVTASRAHTAYGTVNAPSASYHETVSTYDSTLHTYPVSVTNSLGQSASSSYLYALGIPYSNIDPNGWNTSTSYDGFGRVLSITPPGLGQAGVKYEYPTSQDFPITGPYDVKMEIWDATGNEYRQIWGVYDGLGRTLQTQVNDADQGQLLVTETQYNAQGAPYKGSTPFYAAGNGGTPQTGAVQFTETGLDALGRAVSLTQPGDIVTATAYDGLTVTVTDPNGNQVGRTSDGLGRLIYVQEYTDLGQVYATTQYFYDAADRLTSVSDAESNSTEIQYDWLGRKIAMDDMDMGVWNYSYDSLGNLSGQTDARGQDLSFQYDVLNRLISKRDADLDQELASYTYGNTPGLIGFRTAMDNQSGETSWSYADYGRTVSENRTVLDGGAQSMTTVSDWLGRPLTVTYPDGEVLTYSYDALGRPDTLTDGGDLSLVDLAFNSLGQVTEQELGDGVATLTNTYDSTTHRLSNRAAADSQSTPLLDLAYTYEPNGNIATITDNLLGEAHSYTYDFLNRLTFAESEDTTSGELIYRQSFAYDKLGNILQANDWDVDNFPTAYTEPEPRAGIHLAAMRQPEAFLKNAAPVLSASGVNSYTSALLHFDGVDGSTSFTDETGKTWTAAGNAQIDTAQSKFGGSAVLFDGNGDYISTPDSDDFYFGSGDFTIDFWIRFASFPGSGDSNVVFSQYVDGNNRQIFQLANMSGSLEWRYVVASGGSSTIVVSKADSGLALNTWYHVVLVRDGNNWYVFRDGTQVGSTDTNSSSVPDFSAGVWLGAYHSGGGVNDHDGWLDEYRISKGIAHWTSDFIPPSAPYGTEPPPGVDSYTSALLHMDGADGSTAFTDETGRAWTATGNVQIDTDKSVFGGASGLFDGTGDYLYTTFSPDFDFSSGDFTVDLRVWINSGSVSDYEGVISSNGSSDGWGIFVMSDYDSYIRWGADHGDVRGAPLPTGQWIHLAMSREGNTGRFFVNGSEEYSVDLTGDSVQQSGTNLLHIGTNANTNSLVLDGWIDEVRVSKGISRWTSNFTPPTAPYGVGPGPTISDVTAENVTETGAIITWTTDIPSNSQVEYGTTTAYGNTTILNTTPVTDHSEELTGLSLATTYHYRVISSDGTDTATSENFNFTTASIGDNLSGFWNFENIADTTVPDEADGNNPGTLYNGVLEISNGASGDGISLDGDDDYVYIPHHEDLVTGGDFTLSAWINPSEIVTDRTQYIVSKGESGNEYGFITLGDDPGDSGIESGELVFVVGNLEPDRVLGPILTPMQWTLVTGVYDSSAGQLHLYLNGSLAAVKSVTGTLSMGTNALKFGAASTNQYHGSLDEVRFYQRALTGEEIQNQLLEYFPTPTPLPSATPTETPVAPTTTPTPIPVGSLPWGTGADGDLTVASGTTYNINTQNSNGRTCADGGDAVAYSVTSLGSTLATLSSAPSAGCLNPGDEVLLIHLKGTNAEAENAGNYEYLRVSSLENDTVIFSTLKTKWYGDGYHSDINIGTGSGDQKVMLIRVPNYENVTVDGTITGNGWNGYKFGVIPLRVRENLSGSGTISANYSGFGYFGYGSGGLAPFRNGDGGGGGHATAGGAGRPRRGGGGGGTYGNPQLDPIFLGSGGGYAKCNGGNPSGGGSGGGILLITGKTINFAGSFSAVGQDRPSSGCNYGGAGAGGSVRIEGNDVTVTSVLARGGSYTSSHGYGGEGRVAIYYKNSDPIVSSIPSAFTAFNGQLPTPTATPFNLEGNNWGSGADGELNVGSGHIFNLHTQFSGGRSCADGVSYNVIQLGNSSATLSEFPADGCLDPGDEILLAHLHGSGPNIGNYEFIKVGQVTGNTVYFASSKTNYFGDSNDTDSGVGSTQVVGLYRVPNYENVTVDGTLTGNGFDKTKYGILAFRVSGTITGSGNIGMDEKGFQGYGGQGNIVGYGAGGNPTYPMNGHGGGGGYATNGTDGGSQAKHGDGGGTYGQPQLESIYMGSGGGMAYDKGMDIVYPGGGRGGGVVLIAGKIINFSGALSVNGQAKPSTEGMEMGSSYKGGAGSGGSIRIEGQEVTLNTASLLGGSHSETYGRGGQGRIAVYYEDTFSGNFTPGYLQKLDTPDSIFNDGFETGDLSAWAGSFTDGGDLAASESADYWGLHGLSATVNDTVEIYVSDETPDSEMRYRARFYLDPNGLTLTQGDELGLFAGYSGSTQVFKVQMRDDSGSYQVRALAKDDVGIWTETGWHTIQDDWTGLEIDYQAHAHDGSLALSVDGTLMDSLTRVDNITRTVDSVRLGAMGADAGTSGTIYYDDFESRRFSFIGLLLDPGVDDPNTGIPGQEWFSAEYAYNEMKPHAVSTVARPEGTDSYEYDANGNMTCRIEDGETYVQTYNAENRIASMSKLDGNCDSTTVLESWSYAYDGDGIRVSTLHDDGAQTLTRYYFGGAYEETGGAVRIYYNIAGQTVAMRDAEGLKYFLTDHLGSVVAVLDSAGSVLSQTRYLPFGEVRQDVGMVTQTDWGYTFQRSLPDTGLMDYRARFYNPRLGKFIQPDTIVPGAGNPQNFNRYSYVGNSPLNYNDPTGHVRGSCRPGRRGCPSGSRTAGGSGRNSEVIPSVKSTVEGDFPWEDLGYKSDGKPIELNLFNELAEDWYNPFTYDTVGFGAKGLLKDIIGFDPDVTLYWNMKSVREVDFQNFDMSINVGSSMSVGASGEGAAGVYLIGSKGSVKDQSGLQLIVRDGLPVNFGGCIPLGVCGTGSVTFDIKDPEVISSIAYFGGLGEGFDLSVDVISVSDWIIYGSNNTGGDFQVPFLNWFSLVFGN